jgi:hypothetical protein
LTGDLFEIASSQANLSLRPFRANGPAAGDVTFAGTIDWPSMLNVVADNAAPGLPDAGKGDVVWFYQAAHRTVGSGAAAAVYRPATKFARVSSLTLSDGAAATLDVPLAPVPQTGNMSADVRYSQFAALAPQVNPAATSDQFALDVFAMPHGVEYPNQPQDSMVVRPLLLGFDFTHAAAVPPDTNYGVLTYGQFSDRPLWQEFRQILYMYDVPVTTPGASPFTTTAFLLALDSMSPAPPTPIAPMLGPVQAPQIGAKNLFAPQSAVGLQPTISWSPPALGSATSVVVAIDDVSSGAVLRATVRSGRSFRVPPGFLVAGRTYQVTLTAQQAPWDVIDAPPLRSGVPFYSVDCVTSAFTP